MRPGEADDIIKNQRVKQKPEPPNQPRGPAPSRGFGGGSTGGASSAGGVATPSAPAAATPKAGELKKEPPQTARPLFAPDLKAKANFNPDTRVVYVDRLVGRKGYYEVPREVALELEHAGINKGLSGAASFMAPKAFEHLEKEGILTEGERPYVTWVGRAGEAVKRLKGKPDTDEPAEPPPPTT